MNMPDLISILGHASQSLYPVQRLLTGAAYLLGILFFILGLMKLRHLAEQKGHGQEGVFVPMVYLLMGGALLFLPSTLEVLSNTAFGPSSPLSYTTSQPYNVYNSIRILVKTAGLLWFIRGCVLLTQASHPGKQHGPKGLVFIIVGILAVNFESTMAAVNTTMDSLIRTTLTIKTNQGY